jgi:hypothetical protein
MKKIILILIVVQISNFGFSQIDSSKVLKKGFNVETTFRTCNISELNNTLKSSGISEIDNELIGVSLGMYTRKQNKESYSTTNFTWLQSSKNTGSQDSISSKLDIFELYFDMNWVIFNNSKWIFYPNSGLGVGLTRLQLKKNISFNQSITTFSDPAKYISTPNVFVNMGIGAERKIRIMKVNYSIGLILGYKLSTKSKWDYNNSPSISYGGFEYKIRIRIDLPRN